jgi:hypothetical protein
MANGEWRMANGEWRMANGEWKKGKDEQVKVKVYSALTLPFATPHSLLAIRHSPLTSQSRR